MSQLLLSAIPGFVDLPDASISANQPLTDYSIIKISQNAKFAAVRPELIYMGFYTNGNTVPVPASPVDGYQYSYPECIFIPIFAASRAPGPGFEPGQIAFPSLSSSNGGAGQIFRWIVDINDANGIVTTVVSYYVGSGAETPTNDGTVKVYCLATRSSVNLPLGISSD